MQFTHEENTARQEALYRFLLARGDKWTSMEQTTDSIPLYPAYFRKTYHNSRARRMLTADIKAVNNSDEYAKIIVSGSRGIKLATEEDFTRFISSELREVFGKLARVRRLAKKGGKDQQISIEGRIREAFLGGE